MEILQLLFGPSVYRHLRVDGTESWLEELIKRNEDENYVSADDENFELIKAFKSITSHFIETFNEKYKKDGNNL